VKGAALLTDEQAHPVALLRLLLKKYGRELLTDPWNLTVLKRTVQGDFGVELPEVNLHKMLGGLAIATRDEFWEDWEHFHFLVQVLSNNIPDPATHHHLPVGQMMVAVDIATTIRKELKTLSHVPQFNEEVARYVAAQSLEGGVWYLPPPLDFAGRFTAGKSYKCRDCGNKAEVLFDDGLCDVCTDRFDVSSMAGWVPNMKLVGAGWGKNIQIFEKNPTEKVKTRFVAALRGNITLQETQADVCASKLVVAVHFLELRRDQLAAQS